MSTASTSLSSLTERTSLLYITARGVPVCMVRAALEGWNKMREKSKKTTHKTGCGFLGSMELSLRSRF